LEAQIVSISDEIVQVVHDIDDAMRAKDERLLDSSDVEKIWNDVEFPEPYSKELEKYKYSGYASWLLGPLMDDVVNGTFEGIKDSVTKM